MDVADKAIRSTLIGASAVTTLVAQRVYKGLAPLGVTRPYVVFALQAGGETNDTPKEHLDMRYVVQGVAESATTAQAIAAAVAGAMDEVQLAIDAPWTVIRCQRTTLVDQVEVIERKTIWYAGAVYRLRIAK